MLQTLPIDLTRAKVAASLAAQLSRQAVSCSFPADEIGEDAIAWVMLADRCRGRRAAFLKASADLTAKYKAQAVVTGQTIGIRFLSGLYNRTRGNIFVL